MFTPAIQKSSLRGVWRSNHTVLPSQLHHSWPLISMSIVRLCIRRIWLPSVRIVLVPRPFVAVEQEVRIDRIELQMIEIAVLVANLARLAGLQVREDE